LSHSLEQIHALETNALAYGIGGDLLLLASLDQSPVGGAMLLNPQRGKW
jgi:hypothetical protein